MTTPAGWYQDPSGKPMLRYFDGQTWTEHCAVQGSDSPSPMPPPNVLPQHQIGFQGSPYQLPVRRTHRPWLIVAFIAAALVAGVVVLVSTSRDEPSYQAGRAYGSRVLNSQLNEYAIRAMCATGAALAHNREGYYYWPGGQIKASEVNKDDFAKGCVDAAK